MADYFVGDKIPHIQILLKQDDKEFTLGNLKKEWSIDTLENFAIKLHLENERTKYVLSLDTSKSPDTAPLIFFTVSADDQEIFSKPTNWKGSLIITGTDYQKGIGTITLEIQEFHP